MAACLSEGSLILFILNSPWDNPCLLCYANDGGGETSAPGYEREVLWKVRGEYCDPQSAATLMGVAQS